MNKFFLNILKMKKMQYDLPSLTLDSLDVITMLRKSLCLVSGRAAQTAWTSDIFWVWVIFLKFGSGSSGSSTKNVGFFYCLIVNSPPPSAILTETFFSYI